MVRNEKGEEEESAHKVGILVGLCIYLGRLMSSFIIHFLFYAMETMIDFRDMPIIKNKFLHKVV